MESNKPLAAAGYLIGVLFIIVPLYDAATSVWPPHLGDERWRFGALGTLSNLTLVPLLGLLVVLTVAAVRDNRTTRRIVGAVCVILALVLAGLVVLFVLDFFQTRSMVNPRFRQAVTIAASTAIAKHLLTIIALALLSRAGFAGPRPLPRRQRVVTPAEAASSPLIPVGGPARAE